MCMQVRSKWMHSMLAANGVLPLKLSQIHEMVLIEAKHDGFSVLSFLTFDLRFSFIRYVDAAVAVVIGK